MSRILLLAQSNELVVSNQAALALLKMAKTTSEPKVAAGLIEAAAAGLKDQAGELPPPVREVEGATDARQQGT